jgi:hypothetical protein
MTYGLRIINDDSELLIDSEYLNPTFVQKLEFDTTATLVEAASGFIHPGYIRREYKTTNTVSMGVAGMAYVVMWTLPDNGANDIYYNFDSSVAYLTEKLTCYVYANSTGAALTYTLPTAYVFAVTAAGINSLTSTGHALRMYNSAGQKTFDSNFVQLAPYSISDTFAFSVSGANVNNYGTTPVSISLSVPSNPIFMLPDFHALRVNKGPTNSIAHQEYLYEPAFKRVGSTLYSRLYVVDYYNEDYAWPLTQTTFTSGNNNQLSIIVADANLYEAVSAGGGGGGSNPTYTLSSDYSSRNEGTTVVVTLNTTLVANYTEFFYTVTGISAADLSAGGITGKFVIVNNTASASFTFANDLSTGEGTETFLLTLDGLTQSVGVVVNDTSKAGVYSWSTPGNVNEGATGYTTFNATNANGKTVTFGVVAPLAGVTISGSSDGALLTGSWTVSGDAATSINVQYSAVADASTEGPEAFRLVATVDGVTYTSDDIIVNDTSKTIGYSLSAADNWNESNSYSVTVSANNVNGTTLYLTTDNALVVPSSSTVTVNSDSFTNNVTFTTGIATASASVRISLRTGSTAGTEVAFKTITLVNVTPSYSFGTTSAFSEGASGSVQFNYSYAANTAITFEITAPSSGASGASDATLNTTTHSVGATNNAGSVSVTYSAAADVFTEGPEYFRINAKVAGSVVATSGDITINDTSTTPTPTYSLTRSVASVNEPGSFSITFATNQTGSFNYTISGVNSADIAGASLYGSVSNGSVLNYSVTADAATEGTETFTIALDNGQASTSVTINDTSLYPGYGTLVNAYCLSYSSPFTYRQVYNDGYGGTYNVDTVNSATCGYVVTYSLVRSASSVSEGGSFTITLNTNQAGGFGYTITGVNSADLSGASLTGTLYNGDVLSYSVAADAATEGTETFTITLNNQAATTSVTISDTSVYPAYGTLVSASCLTYSSPYTYRQVYNNGSGGTYNVDTNNSTTCGYVAPTPYGTYLSYYCAGGNGYSLYYRYADGNYSYYDVLQANNSATCGYVAPAYSIGNTWTTLGNGAGPNFYFYATNANGTYVTVSASGPGASRVTISPTTFTVSGSSFLTYIQVTASLPSSATPAQSCTISLSTGQSFTFTIAEVTAQIPWVTSVVDTMYNDIYYNGETITYAINMSSSITPTTIVRVAVWINVLANGTGGQESGYNDFTGGQPISGINGFFPLGTLDGYYTTNPNAGYNFRVMVKARTISPGNVQSTYVNGTVRRLSSNPPP